MVTVVKAVLTNWRFYLFVLGFYLVALGVFALFLFLGLDPIIELRWISVAIFAATIVGFAVASVLFAPVRARLRQEFHVE